MREVKFRANRFGEIFDVLEWNFTGHPLRQGILLGKNGKPILREWIKNLDIMQYTGLKDKNGKEIYEGDILKPVGNFVNTPSFIVDGDYNELAHIKDFYTDDKAVEVIGNIYENPEILEEKEKK